MVQSKGLVESETDETGNLFRNNEFLVNLNIVVEFDRFCPRVLSSIPLCKRSAQKCYNKVQYKNLIQ